MALLDVLDTAGQEEYRYALFSRIASGPHLCVSQCDARTIHAHWRRLSSGLLDYKSELVRGNVSLISGIAFARNTAQNLTFCTTARNSTRKYFESKTEITFRLLW